MERQDNMTYFAPAERAPTERVREQFEHFSRHHCKALMDAVPTIIMVLNRQRQLVFSNATLVKVLGLDNVEPLLGQRPGEIFGCVHVDQGHGGCGTSEFCTQCGAVKAILASLRLSESVRECKMLRRSDKATEALDLRVTATPFELDGELFSVFSITDISHENRRRALERIFFHDILNTAGGLLGMIELLKDEIPEDERNLGELMQTGVETLIEEINSQRELSAAEQNELVPDPVEIDAAGAARLAARRLERHKAAMGRTIEVKTPDAPVTITADATLVNRILVNMLKNGLEAVPKGKAVTISTKGLGDGGVLYTVRNPGDIPRDIQLQIFKRSFSTKGASRGLGTYSMRLLAERYLGGEVWFESGPEDTSFHLKLPPVPPDCPTPATA